MKPSRAAVYEPYGRQDRDQSNVGRTYGVHGVNPLAVIKGLTLREAQAVAKAIRGLDHREVVAGTRD